jgi:hypothetical protein
MAQAMQHLLNAARSRPGIPQRALRFPIRPGGVSKIKISTVVATVLGIGTLLLGAGQGEADWRYTDDKGKSRTVTLKSDVPSQYRYTAVPIVDPHSTSARDELLRAEPVVVPQVPAPSPLGPGAQWWTCPVGSPERAAARLTAEQNAAAARQRATDARTD